MTDDEQRIWDTYLKADPEHSDILVNKRGMALLLGVDPEAIELMLMFNGRDTSANAIPESMQAQGRKIAARVNAAGAGGSIVDTLAFLEKHPQGVIRQ